MNKICAGDKVRVVSLDNTCGDKPCEKIEDEYLNKIFHVKINIGKCVILWNARQPFNVNDLELIDNKF